MATVTQAPGETVAEGHIDPAASLRVKPVQTRSERKTSFDPADFPAPTGREVNWKYSPLGRLAGVLSTDPVDPAAVRIDAGAAQAYLVHSSGTEAAGRGEVFRPEDLPAAIAWTQSIDALHVRIPAEASVTEPLRLDLVGDGSSRRGAMHVIVEAMPHSRATVVLYHSGSAQFAQNVEIIARDGAQLTVIAVHRWDDDAVHAASHQARVDRDARLTHIVVTLGGSVVRVNPSVRLAGSGAEGRLYGLAFADAGQHFESQVYLHHEGEHTVGDVLYKGALQGASARSVWIGDVLIGPDATGTDSYEANRNLVLTDGARADSVPNLEIETGDILGAGHASATGRFDDEQLFYLQARGIAEDEARRLVVLGFLNEIVQHIDVAELADELTGAIERELVDGAAL
jgi:Fe-S cluster assembly protein SufD